MRNIKFGEFGLPIRRTIREAAIAGLQYFYCNTQQRAEIVNGLVILNRKRTKKGKAYVTGGPTIHEIEQDLWHGIHFILDMYRTRATNSPFYTFTTNKLNIILLVMNVEDKKHQFTSQIFVTTGQDGKSLAPNFCFTL